MATLHATTLATRKVLAILAMVVGGIFLLIVFINFGKIIKTVFFPSPPPPPTVAFGKLPKLVFPHTTATIPYSYTLNTLSGDLPIFPDRAKTFKLKEPEANLLSLDKAKTLVSPIGFSNTPTQLSSTKYQWVMTDDLTKTLSLDIISYDFSLTSPYTTNPSVEAATNLPDENTAVDMVNTFLSDLTLLPSDSDSNKTKTSLFAINNGIISPATSLSNTQVIRVDLFQKDIDGLPVLYDQPAQSTMNFLVGGGPIDPQIVAANFSHKEVSNTSATYPILTAKEAYQRLQKGNAYIASVAPSATAISIRDVYLAYFLGSSVTKYLQPIIVFQGDNGFFAYVPAIRDEWEGK